MMKKTIYRFLFLVLTILIIPLVPILIIFAGVSSPEYVMKGTLNIDLSEAQQIGYWGVYTRFLARIIRFDLGTSTSSGRSVGSILFARISESIKIIVPSAIISYFIGTLIGLWTLSSQVVNKIWNRLRFVFFIPIIVISYLLLYFLSLIGIDITSDIKYAAAIAVLSLYPIYVVVSALRKTLRELHSSDFFLFHQALGFSRGEVWRKFGYRFIVIDYLSFFENILIFMIGFLFFVETPIGIYGMGYEFLMSVVRFDYPVIIGFCIFGIILLSITGLVVDMLKIRLDKRIANV